MVFILEAFTFQEKFVLKSQNDCLTWVQEKDIYQRLALKSLVVSTYQIKQITGLAPICHTLDSSKHYQKNIFSSDLGKLHL